MKFYVFHINVVPVDGEAVFAHDSMTPGKKNQAIVDAMRARATGVYRRRHYRLYDLRMHGKGEDVVYGHIASPDHQEIAQPDDMDEELIRRTVESHRWTHFLYLGDGEQYIVVMDKPDFFSGSVRGVSRFIQDLLVQGLDLEKYPGYTFEVEPKTDKRGFWDIIGLADRIYKVRFDLVTPNAFGGSEDLRNMLNLQRTKHNATRVMTELNNEAGELELDPEDEELQAEVEYASKGAGRIRIAYSADGSPVRRWSSDQSRVSFEVDFDGSVDSISLQEKVEAILRRLRGLL